MERYGSSRFARVIRVMIDVLNMILGIAVVAAAVFTFLNVGQRAWLFPIIFAMGAGMNLLSGIKYMMTERYGGGITMLVFSLILLGIAYFTFYSVGGLF